ncbi:MAG TPA: LysR family transcriptional regulator [Gammaproteobacteria bacterium]|nr:LysR family transcriptional regulator [Gammaproteobacteria bacterium]
MDLELFRTFLELSRTRHFGRSAEALNLTQAAVSNRIKTLERILQVRLFDRSTREVSLTPEGQRLIRHAERQIAAWRAARQDVSSAGSTEQLTFGGSLRLWDAVLQPWLHDLRLRYSRLAIIAEAHTPEVLTRGLIDATLDVAVMLEPAQLENLRITEVATIELVCVSSLPNVPIEAALGSGYVYVDWGLTHGLDHRRAFPDAPEAMTRVSQGRMALELIRKVGGAAYLPASMIREDLESGYLHRVEAAPVFLRKAYATYLVRSARLTLVEACVELIQNRARSETRLPHD